MLVSAAVCPHPPALVPAVSREASGQLDDLRVACTAAVRRLRGAEPDLLVCIGGGRQTRAWSGEAGGTLQPYGVDARFGGALVELPLSLTVAAYLLESAGAANGDAFQAVSPDAAADDCSSLGAELAGRADRVALLVMGDGSARRTRTSPGPFDERAQEFDDGVRKALAAPDPGRLLAIDAELARELWVSGLQAWQTLGGALRASPTEWASRVTYSAAPFGVGYVVIEIETR